MVMSLYLLSLPRRASDYAGQASSSSRSISNLAISQPVCRTSRTADWIGISSSMWTSINFSVIKCSRMSSVKAIRPQVASFQAPEWDIGFHFPCGFLCKNF